MDHFFAPEQMAVYVLDLCAVKTAGHACCSTCVCVCVPPRVRNTHQPLHLQSYK